MRTVIVIGLFLAFATDQSIGAESPYENALQMPENFQVVRLPEIEELPPPEPIAFLKDSSDRIIEIPVQTVVVKESKSEAKLWSGGFELGMNGSTGDTDTFNLRFGFNAKRKTERNTASVDLDYHKNTNDGLETANRFFGEWRLEKLYKDSPWECFIHGIVDYDEFQAFNVRVSSDAGIARWIVKNDSISYKVRAGGGYSHTFGSDEDADIDESSPELTFGMDAEYKISKRQKLTFTTDYYPNITDFTQYHIYTKAAWQVLLDEEMNLSLKLSLLDRYDTASKGTKDNKLDYAAVLLWQF